MNLNALSSFWGPVYISIFEPRVSFADLNEFFAHIEREIRMFLPTADPSFLDWATQRFFRGLNERMVAFPENRP
jgi:hypothetical protein